MQVMLGAKTQQRKRTVTRGPSNSLYIDIPGMGKNYRALKWSFSLFFYHPLMGSINLPYYQPFKNYSGVIIKACVDSEEMEQPSTGSMNLLLEVFFLSQPGYLGSCLTFKWLLLSKMIPTLSGCDFLLKVWKYSFKGI